MNTDLSNLIALQRQRLEELRDDAPDIAATIADEIWDHFEIEIDDATENGIDFNLAGMISTSLSTALLQAYDQAFEHHVLARCEHLRANLAQALGSEAIDTARIDLSGLRKSLKLRRNAQELIDQAIERAKPRVSRILQAVVGNLFRSPIEELDALEERMQEGARHLHRELLALREPLRARVTEESLAVIQSARLEMARQIDLWVGKAPTA